MITAPFDDRDGFIWFDGKLTPWRDCKIHVLTHGLHYASSVFEGMRVYNGKVFKLTEHNERFIKSANILGFDLPYKIDELNDATNLIVKTQNITDGYVRPIAWRGSEKMKIYAPGNKIHVAIATWVWPTYFPEELYKTGIKLCWSDWRRPAPDMAPIAAKAGGLYMICTLSKQKAEDNGFEDAMMLDYRGYLAEATGANFFMFIDGELHTPIADCFLNGITRQTVISMAKELGMKVHERHIKPEELSNATECFLTGTAAEITPVGTIGEYKFKPSHLTEKLMTAYKQLVRA